MSCAHVFFYDVSLNNDKDFVNLIEWVSFFLGFKKVDTIFEHFSSLHSNKSKLAQIN